MSESVEVIDVTVADLTPARVEHSALVRPAASVPDVLTAFDEFTNLKRQIVLGSDVQRVQGKEFIKRSGYRKLAAAFGVSFEIRERVLTNDDRGRIVKAEFIVRAEAPGGRFADGWGNCDIYERCDLHNAKCPDDCKKHCGGPGLCDGAHHFSKAEHDVPATAETRAKNRACADLFGMGEVSAEEVDRSDPTMRQATTEDVAAVRNAAKRYKEAGGTIVWPSDVLGVVVLEEDDQGHLYPPITSAQALDLVERLGAQEAALKAGASLGDDVGGGAPASAGTEDATGSSDTPASAAPTPPSTPPSEPSPPARVSGDDAGDDGATDPVEPASPAPPPPSDDDPAAGAAGHDDPPEPIKKSTTNGLGTLGGAIGMTRPVRLQLYTMICDRPIGTGNEMTDAEGKRALKAMRLIRDGLLEVAYLDADGNEIDSEDGVLSLRVLDPSDGLTPPEQLDGYRFLRQLAADNGLQWVG